MSLNPFSSANGPSPSTNPFASRKESINSMAEAILAAYSGARGEWREYLPHGVPIPDYAAIRCDWLSDLAVSSATQVLLPFLPRCHVAIVVNALALAAFHDASGELATYEPDHLSVRRRDKAEAAPS